MNGSDKESGGNTVGLIFSVEKMTPERKRALEKAFMQHKKDDEKIIQKYAEIVQKDIVLLIGENLTSEELGKYGCVTYTNISNLLYERLSDSGEYTDECRDKITFYTNDILIKMKHDNILEEKGFPLHGGGQDPEELSYKLSEKGAELLKFYLKEEKKDKKHEDALEILNPF